jgi:hypothetical protein
MELAQTSWKKIIEIVVQKIDNVRKHVFTEIDVLLNDLHVLKVDPFSNNEHRYLLIITK